MVSFDTAATLTLIIILAAVVLYNRKKLTFQRFTIFYAAMYRTKRGIGTMDKIAKKYGRFFEITAPLVIGLGFIGMAIVTFDLARSLITVLMQTSSPSVGVVLPFKAKGVFYVPFAYWIISIFVILIIHEGMHGVMARVYKLPVKNSGLVVLGALIPIIPGAFVEPDEKKLMKASRKKQLAVYAAGPVSNLVTGLMLMAVFFWVLTPITDGFYSQNGIVVTDLMGENSPAELAGITPGTKFLEVDGHKMQKPTDFQEALKDKNPGETVNVITGAAMYDVTLGQNPDTEKAWFGVFVDRALVNPTWVTYSVLWVSDLVFWLFVLSIGVGLFNLIPLGPIDGGRMFLTVLEKYTHKQHHAARIWKSVSFLLLGILVTNVVLAFL